MAWIARARLAGAWPSRQAADDEDSPSETIGGSDLSGSDLADELMIGFEEGAESARRVVRLARVASRRMKRLGARDLPLERIASCGSSSKHNRRNLSRNFHALLDKLGKRIGVEVASHTVTLRAKWPKIQPEKKPYPMVTLSAWAKCILRDLPRYFLGGCNNVENTEVYTRTFHMFWTNYRHTQPDHVVYETFPQEQWGYIIPYALHGDEGRGRNFIPTLVVAFQMLVHPLGMGYTNTASHSFRTRFLSTVISTKIMLDETWDEIHEVLARDCYDLFWDGLTVNGKTFFFACCGIKGDWVYLRKALKLESGFRSTRVCHYCDTTEWWKFGSNLRSWNGQLVDPWKIDEPPTPLRTIPGVESPLLIRTDPAHTWPIGVGKEFAASTIFLLCHLDVWPANNMPDKLLGAWEHFQTWRYRTKHTCKLHEFTYKTFKVQSLQQYPVLGGSGSDCIVVCKWLESVVDDPAMLPAFHDRSGTDLWELIKYTVLACNTWFRGMYQHGLFVSAESARKLLPYGWGLVEGYGLLAAACCQRRWCLYRVKPKLHMQEHFPKEWEQRLTCGAEVLIIFLAWACWSDEDFIGRVCRISRVTHPFTTGYRTIFRALMKYRRLLDTPIPMPRQR